MVGCEHRDDPDTRLPLCSSQEQSSRAVTQSLTDVGTLIVAPRFGGLI